MTIPVALTQLLSVEQAWNYRVIPYEKEGDTYRILTDAQPPYHEKEEILGFLLDASTTFQIIEEAEMTALLTQYYRQNSRQVEQKKLAFADKDFFFKLVDEAIEFKSSDIHIETYEKRCRVRFRIDGVLVERYELSASDYPSFVNKIKIQANLDIAEKRLPQDGRIYIQKDGTGASFDIRVSVLPTLYGEKVVMRLLKSSAANIDLEKLGFSRHDLDIYLGGTQRSNGMILISGPTGSGKSTTLYATIKLLNKNEKNILTIEDPIEYTLEGVNQVQLKESIGLDFAAAMKTFLRQDPDIIMLGEIRDPSTANMAVRASLTGHLVLSTIHTNSAWGIVARLLDMGIPAYLLAETLNMAVAQRLVRLLCPHCKERSTLFPERLISRFPYAKSINHHFTAKGCDKCYFTGYHGRKAIYEVINVDDELSALIKAERLDVKTKLQEKGVTLLPDLAFNMVKDGLTTFDEAYSIMLGT